MLEIRPVLPQEHHALGELTASTYVTEGLSDEHYAVKLADVSARAAEATVLVAVEDGSIVGGVTVVTRGGSYAEGQPLGTAVIRSLVTSPAARGRGVGKALVEACVAEAVTAGCHRIRLSTQPRMASAHRLYEREGFTRTPDEDWWPTPAEQLLTFARTLGWCGVCGEPGRHPQCEAKLEPPRYCAQCRRRMVVQVHPTGWTARCVEHGVISGA